MLRAAAVIEFVQIVICYLIVGALSLSFLHGITLRLAKAGVPDGVAPVAAFIVSGIVAYPALFLNIASKPAGYAYSIIVALVSIAWFRPAAFRPSPFLFAFACGLAYLAALHLFDTELALRELPEHIFFEMPRPGDHLLPYTYAFKVLGGGPERFGMSGGWHFTDRPPLETSFLLMFRPFAKLVDLSVLYQAVGTMLQVSCLAATWYLCRALRLRAGETRLVLLTLAGSGFIYYNSVYLWPKLLAAAYVIGALVPLAVALTERRKLTPGETGVAAAGCALALLSHGGVAFSILALAILAAVFAARLFTLRGALTGVAVAVALYLPWQAYTTFVDPNAGKLLKMHLTNGDPDSPESFGTLLKKAYTSITFDQWLSSRASNLTVLAGAPYVDAVTLQIARGLAGGERRPLVSNGHDNAIQPQGLDYSIASLATVLRIDQREFFLRALGPMTLGLLIVPFLLLPRLRQRLSAPGIGALILLELVTVVVWAVVNFNPGANVLTHASYALVVLAYLISASLLWRLSPALGWTIGFASIVSSIVLWVVFVPGPMIAQPRFDWLAAVALATGAVAAVRLSREPLASAQ